jgi:hypothetical protein
VYLYNVTDVILFILYKRRWLWFVLSK